MWQTVTLATARVKLPRSELQTARYTPQVRANDAWTQPTPYLTVERTQEQWVALRDALANERISAEAGEAADDGAVALLEQVRSDPSVSAALANIDANLALITATWESEIGL